MIVIDALDSMHMHVHTYGIRMCMRGACTYVHTAICMPTHKKVLT